MSGKCRDPSQSAEPLREDNRNFVNIVTMVFVVALIIGAIWVFRMLQNYGEIENCVASGRRNCADLVHPDAP